VFRLRILNFRHAATAAAVLTLSCTGAPAPAPAPAPRSASWLCATAPLDIALQKAGVPAGSQAIDVALSTDKVSILLAPARIVTFSRTDPRDVDMIVGGEKSPWRAIDRDPTDGSLWVASDESVSLLHITEGGERKIVPGPAVQGQGGLRQIRVARDAIYATPTSAQSAVWRMSRTGGRLLGQAFEQEKTGEVPDARDALRWNLWLARDLDGSVVAFDLWTGELYRAGDDGAWAPLPARFPAHPRSSGRSLHGAQVGTSSESWYFTDDIRGLFFTPAGPALLGAGMAGVRTRGTVLFRLKDGRIETATEECTRTSLTTVVSDSVGFAAISGEMVETSTTGQRSVYSGHVLVGRYAPAN
jgi:hypothetical protein